MKDKPDPTLTLPWTGSIWFPENKKPYPFQIDAAKFSLSRKYSYLGLDPRLGKTIVAALIFNATQRESIVYVCPPFLVNNVIEKLSDWISKDFTVSKFSLPMTWPWPDITVIPDTMIHRDDVGEFVRSLTSEARTLHCNSRLIVDEAHRFKDFGSRRTKALFGKIAPHFDFVTHMSGTPMPNRPHELWPVLKEHAHETISYMSEFQYGRAFCDLKEKRIGNRTVWDWTGSSDIKDLGRRIKGKFMLRLRRKDVLKDLPPLIEEMVIIDDDMPPYVARLNERLNLAFNPDDIKDEVTDSPHVATYRRELGVYKAQFAVKFILDILETTKEKVLVFAIHKEVVTSLKEGLKDYFPLIITGDTPTGKRFDIVNKFQSEFKSRVLIGNIDAMGLGFDLWKADRAIMVEFSWVPGNNTQAVDRLFKMGKETSVFAQYLVFRNSLDKNILSTNFRKKKDLEQI